MWIEPLALFIIVLFVIISIYVTFYLGYLRGKRESLDCWVLREEVEDTPRLEERTMDLNVLEAILAKKRADELKSKK